MHNIFSTIPSSGWTESYYFGCIPDRRNFPETETQLFTVDFRLHDTSADSESEEKEGDVSGSALLILIICLKLCIKTPTMLDSRSVLLDNLTVLKNLSPTLPKMQLTQWVT